MKLYKLFLIISIVAFTLGFSSDSLSVGSYSEAPLIRFHVLANSDSPGDQALKLKVRDAVIKEMIPLLADVKDKNEARKKVDDNRNLIKSTAEKTISENGYSYDLKVSRGNFIFPAKTYHVKEPLQKQAVSLTLPAGRYEAVRVVIGSGKGANWWCVLFPPLCFVSPEENNADKPGSPIAVQYNSKTHNKVEYRFKVLDLYRKANNSR